MDTNKNRKTCIVSFQNDVEDSHLLSLTSDQINLLNWLGKQGFDITLTVHDEVEII